MDSFSHSFIDKDIFGLDVDIVHNFLKFTNQQSGIGYPKVCDEGSIMKNFLKIHVFLLP